MPPIMSASARLLPLVDAWFDILASLVAAQRLLTYSVLAAPEPAELARHAAPHPLPDEWRGTPA
jgi:hypothetical protein